LRLVYYPLRAHHRHQDCADFAVGLLRIRTPSTDHPAAEEEAATIFARFHRGSSSHGRYRRRCHHHGPNPAATTARPEPELHANCHGLSAHRSTLDGQYAHAIPLRHLIWHHRTHPRSALCLCVVEAAPARPFLVGWTHDVVDAGLLGLDRLHVHGLRYVYPRDLFHAHAGTHGLVDGLPAPYVLGRAADFDSGSF